jgi:hypothetical protein
VEDVAALPVLLGSVPLELEACPLPLELLALGVSVEDITANCKKKRVKILSREYNV